MRTTRHDPATGCGRLELIQVELPAGASGPAPEELWDLFTAWHALSGDLQGDATLPRVRQLSRVGASNILMWTLEWQSDPSAHANSLGEALRRLLREHGLTHHSVWLEAPELPLTQGHHLLLQRERGQGETR